MEVKVGSAAVPYLRGLGVAVLAMVALVILQELLSYLSYSALLVPVPFFALLHVSLTGSTLRSLLQGLVAEWQSRVRAEVPQRK